MGMRKLTPWAVLCISAIVGCDKQAPVTEKAPGVLYGTAITDTHAVSIADVVAKPDAFTGKPVVVDGEVRKCCSRKGCWMELAESSASEGAGARVTFKDYGFFVPTDSQGAKARVQGTLDVRTLSAQDVAHLESEGGKFGAKAADGTARELAIVATGVELHR